MSVILHSYVAYKEKGPRNYVDHVSQFMEPSFTKTSILSNRIFRVYKYFNNNGLDGVTQVKFIEIL